MHSITLRLPGTSGLGLGHSGLGLI